MWSRRQGRVAILTPDSCSNTPHSLLVSEAVPPSSHREDKRVFLASLRVCPCLVLHPVHRATRVHRFLAWGATAGGKPGEQEVAGEQPRTTSHLAPCLYGNDRKVIYNSSIVFK